MIMYSCCKFYEYIICMKMFNKKTIKKPKTILICVKWFFIAWQVILQLPDLEHELPGNEKPLTKKLSATVVKRLKQLTISSCDNVFILTCLPYLPGRCIFGSRVALIRPAGGRSHDHRRPLPSTL